MVRSYYTILFVLLTAAAYAQSGVADTAAARKKIDSAEGILLNRIIFWHEEVNGSTAADAAGMLSMSRQAGYIHGMAVAFACQAAIEQDVTDNFRLSEQEARQSLYWFDRTDNKAAITLAYYSLGFALFAQSHFDEALRDFDTARQYAHRSGGRAGELVTLKLMANAYEESGDYDKAFNIMRNGLQQAEAMHKPDLTGMFYEELAGIFMQIEDYPQAEHYFRLRLDQVGGRPEKLYNWNLAMYAELLTREHKYDSALYYYDRMDSAHVKTTFLRTYLVSKGEYYLARKEFATALPYFVRSLAYQRQINDRNQQMRCLEDLSKTYAGLHREKEAFRNASEELSLARDANARQNIRDASQLLSMLYDREGRADSAYWYYRRYIVLKDSVLNDQLRGRFAFFGFEQQIQLLNEQKQVEDVCLQEEMMSKNLLICGLLALLLFIGVYVWIVRLKRRNEAHRRKRAEDELEIQRLEGERAQAALQQRARELEIQALRSQMNPHFIFNCLNAINRFILGHETEAASDYLTKFSRLMRMIMNHSRQGYISLAEELDILRLYLDMEQLRFKDAFDYSIVIEDEIDIDEIRIPPLLIQPFVENAVWHGLMHKEERGSLSILLWVTGDLLTCVIRDNGIGRHKAGMLKSKSVEKHKSMGMQITAERMALLSNASSSTPFFRLEDLYDEQGEPAGTEVTLTIKVECYDKCDYRG